MRYKPRFAAKVDANQKDIVDALFKIGCSVVELSVAKGAGLVDLLVGYQQETVLLEVKNPDGRNRIDEDQERFHAEWRGGPIFVVRSPEEAVRVVLETVRNG